MEDTTRNRLKIILYYPIRNHLFRTSVLFFTGLLSIIIDLNLFLNTYVFIIFYFFILWITYPIILDLNYYYTYFHSKGLLSILLFQLEKNNQILDVNLDNFHNSYNNIRKEIKRRIMRPRDNFLKFEIEIDRIIQDIDIFFNSTIKILYKKKLMSTQFTTQFEQFINNNEIYNKYSNEENELKLIDEFLDFFGKIIINKSPPTNTIIIGEFFRKWNSIVENFEPNIFNESKNEIEKYYKEKNSKHSIIFEKFFDKMLEILKILLLAIIFYLLTLSSNYINL